MYATDECATGKIWMVALKMRNERLVKPLSALLNAHDQHLALFANLQRKMVRVRNALPGTKLDVGLELRIAASAKTAASPLACCASAGTAIDFRLVRYGF